MITKIRHLLEYICFRALAGLLNRLPYRAALAVGWGLAWLGFYVGRYRVRAAVRRIQEVFPGRYTDRAARRVAWLSWRNFMFTAVEMIRIPVSKPAWVKAVVEVGEAAVPIQEQLKGGRGAIIATIHMGSWEMASLTCLAYGIPLFSLAAVQKNHLVDDYLNRARAGSGFETLLRSASVLKQIIRKIREGKVLAILPDVRSKTPGLSIRFLGQTMNVAGGMGLIARLTGVPIFPCIITRRGWTRHCYRSFAPIRSEPALAKDEDILRITQAVFDVYDQCIRAEPEQWFWFNKRWIFDPLPAAAPGTDRALAPDSGDGVALN
jgi:KDO2-lipid IV(A) lauroyltransferase